MAGKNRDDRAFAVGKNLCQRFASLGRRSIEGDSV